MHMEIITDREDLLIRRQVLAPGEATPWHVDVCHRFSVVIRGESLTLEYRDAGERQTFPVAAGQAGWGAPEARAHRAVNTGTVVFEEVVTFYRDAERQEPQPGA